MTNSMVMNDEIFQRVLGWETQQIHKLSKELRKAPTFAILNLPRDPQQFVRGLYEALNQIVELYSAYHARVILCTPGQTKESKKHRISFIRIYCLEMRWLDRARAYLDRALPDSIATIKIRQRSLSEDDIPDGGKVRRTLSALSEALSDCHTNEAAEFRLFYGWMCDLKAAPVCIIGDEGSANILDVDSIGAIPVRPLDQQQRAGFVDALSVLLTSPVAVDAASAAYDTPKQARMALHHHASQILLLSDASAFDRDALVAQVTALAEACAAALALDTGLAERIVAGLNAMARATAADELAAGAESLREPLLELLNSSLDFLANHLRSAELILLRHSAAFVDLAASQSAVKAAAERNDFIAVGKHLKAMEPSQAILTRCRHMLGDVSVSLESVLEIDDVSADGYVLYWIQDLFEHIFDSGNFSAAVLDGQLNSTDSERAMAVSFVESLDRMDEIHLRKGKGRAKNREARPPAAHVHDSRPEPQTQAQLREDLQGGVQPPAIDMADPCAEPSTAAAPEIPSSAARVESATYFIPLQIVPKRAAAVSPAAPAIEVVASTERVSATLPELPSIPMVALKATVEADCSAALATGLEQANCAAASSSALDGCLSACEKNDFDLAYWLSWLAKRNGVTGWSHDAFSTFALGTRVSADGFIDAELSGSLERLQAAPPEDAVQRMFVASGMLAPILFCARPGSIYALRTQVETGLPKFDEFFSRVADVGLSKGITLTGLDVKLAGESTDSASLRCKLQQESEQELYRAQNSKMAFWPGEQLLHALYRDGESLHTLHSIVTQDDTQRLALARQLLAEVNPEQLAASYELAPFLVPGRWPAMIGPARTKFLKYVNVTLSLARCWVELIDNAKGNVDNFRLKQIDELRDYVRKANAEVLEELDSHRRDGSTGMNAALKAATCAIERLCAMLAGTQTKPKHDIYTMLLPHPGVALDDDFMPAAEAEEGLVLMLEQAQPQNPLEAFHAALSRNEFVRALFLLDQLGASTDLTLDYELAFDRACKKIEHLSEELETSVEDAFLLGDLALPSDETQVLDILYSQQAERTRQLNKIMQVRSEINAVRENRSTDPRLLHIVKMIDEVSRFMAAIHKRSRSKMEQDSLAIADKFPSTPDGDEDRVLFRKQFSHCLLLDDHVAAMEVIHQGAAALHANTRLSTAAPPGSDAVLQFEVAESQLQMALAASNGKFDELSLACQTGGAWGGQEFCDLSKDDKDNASLAVTSIEQARQFPSVENMASMLEQILTALGYACDGSPRVRAKLGGKAYRVFDAGLGMIPVCPVPAFGSGLHRKLTVLVLASKYNEDELIDLIAQLNLKRNSLLVFSMHAATMAMRQKLHSLCAHKAQELLLVDMVTLVFVLARRRRLRTFYDVTLPFTYSQPYQEKGENVPEETFVGREKEVDSLVSGDGACIVFGGRQLGKTATLRHIVNRYHDPDAHQYIVYKDIDDLGAAGDAEDYESTRYSFWTIIAQELSSAGLAGLRNIDGKGKFRVIENDVIAAVKANFDKQAETRVTLLLDEADDLIELDARHDFGLVKTLRQLMVETNRRFKVVFAGLESVQRYQRMKNHPFAQLGRETVIGPLPTLAARSLVVAPMRALGFEFESHELVLRIMSAVNYHPGLMQIFCFRLLTRCYEKLARQRKFSGVVRTITRDDLREIERNLSFTEDIQKRFDWTLDLDDRYKLLTYALVISGNPTAARTEAEFLKMGADWWGAEFMTMDQVSIGSLLEEMEGLGVLVRSDEGGLRTYQLRSPNLLRLLGNRDAIEKQLERIIEQPARRKASPRQFHAITVDGKSTFISPFNFGQEAELFSRPELVGISLIFGSDALGMSRLEAGVRRVAKDVGGADGWSAKSIEVQFCTHVERFAGEASKFMRERKRKHMYLMASGDLLTQDRPLREVVAHIADEIKGSCTKDSRARVFISGGPGLLWKCLLERRLHGMPYMPEIMLAPWTDSAVWKGLEAAGLRTNAKQCSGDLLRISGGFQFLLEATIADCVAGTLSSADDALPVLEARVTALAAVDVRRQLGIAELPHALQQAFESFTVLIERDEKGISSVRRSDVLELLRTLGEDEFNEIFAELGREAATEIVIAWMSGLGLLRGTNVPDCYTVPEIVVTHGFAVN